MSAPSLAGKVYAITGGASGMGLATVKRLVQAQARAVCIGDFNDSNFPQVKEALEALNKEGSTTIVLTKLDVSKSASVNAWIDSIISQFNALDGCLNAAGIPQMVGARGEPAILEETDEAWDTVMGVNLHGVFYCMRAEIAAMVKLEKKPRSIVNIASMAALRYSTDIFAYSVSKWGAAVLSTAVAKDVESAGTDIRVNAVSPGGTKTPMLMKFVGPKALEAAKKSGVERRSSLIEPDDVAAVVVWLLSEDSSQVYGVNIPVGESAP